MTLRPYQSEIAQAAAEKVRQYNLVYLAMEVRTGKTLTALETCRILGAKNVLFLTKKKAIASIQSDYDQFGFTFKLTVINDESMHKLVFTEDFDIVIHDEHHRFGSYPKPSQRTKLYKLLFSWKPQIWLSGTPHPESYSQIFHQFWVSAHSPWKGNFYKWVGAGYVTKKKVYLGYSEVWNYSDANEQMIKAEIYNYMIRFSQEDSGFQSKIDEQVIEVEMKPATYVLANRLKKDLIIEGKNEVILGDTGAKLMSKLHQIYSGSVKFESGESMILDDSKAVAIRDRFKGQKVAIFYKFKEELNIIKSVMKNIVTTVEEFDADDTSWIALQIVSGREGISLKKADALIYFNIDYSAVSYWQSRDRMTTNTRKESLIYWIFAKRGIEKRVYKAVQDKKNYTLSIFKKDERTAISSQADEAVYQGRIYSSKADKNHHEWHTRPHASQRGKDNICGGES